INLDLSASIDYSCNAEIKNASSAEYSSNVEIENESFAEFSCNAIINLDLSASIDSSCNTEIINSSSVDASLNVVINNITLIDMSANAFVPAPRRYGGNWQRKMWLNGEYYWRGRYDANQDEIIFEYIAKTGLEGNTWAENENAAIDASGFSASCIEADFTVRGARDGIPATIHYSDGVDTWIAESDEASATGWAWQNTTKVFDAVDANDEYCHVNLCANRTTPTPKFWASAVFEDDSEGKQWIRTRQQTTGGDITGWQAVADVSNVDNTNVISGSTIRSMGTAGAAKDDVIYVYKEGTAIRSRFWNGVSFETIQDVDTTVYPITTKALFDFEHTTIAGTTIAGLLYRDADGTMQWKERTDGSEDAWGANEELESGMPCTLACEGIVDWGSGFMIALYGKAMGVVGYRIHEMTSHEWHPALVSGSHTFSTVTDAIVATLSFEQGQTPDRIPGEEAVPFSWIGTLGPSSYTTGWGIIYD
ncbi:unnamed protein product, partial [marine sediment metagenome]